MRKRPISDPWWWGGLVPRRNELTDPPQAEVVVPRALKYAAPEFCSRRLESAGGGYQPASSAQSAALSPPHLPFHTLRLDPRFLRGQHGGRQFGPTTIG